MKTVNIPQGSPDWHQFRAQHYGASEAPSMMGASKYKTRSALLDEKKTGIGQYVDEDTQRLFDRGHAAEAAARPIVESHYGIELYPVTGECDANPKLSASFDGLTMESDIVWEHKLWGEKLAAQVRAGQLEPHYYWQLEQQLLVSGAEYAIFTTSDGTAENMESMEYRPVAERTAALVAGWAQFEADLAKHEVKAPTVNATGQAPETLPALHIEVTGMVKASNLGAFKSHALAVIGAVNTDLNTDQDFADAEAAVKWCGDVEKRLAAAKERALSQTADIDALFKAIDDISAEARRKRLDLDKLVKARKETVRYEIKAQSEQALRDHIAALEKRISPLRMPNVLADIGAAMKGKRTIASLRDAADTELARAKIEASAIADDISANLKALYEHGANYRFLFTDMQAICTKAPDDFAALVKLRVSEHKAEQQRREDEQRARLEAEAVAKAEAERERIRAEEQAKADQTPAQPPLQPQNTPISSVSVPESLVKAPSDTGKRIKLGDINQAFAPVSITQKGLAELGFDAVGKDKNAVLYRACDLYAIGEAIIGLITISLSEK